MKKAITVGKLVVLTLLIAASARATTILDVSGALAASDPLQLGRLSRNGIQQDWVGTEPFPGSINPTTAYHYTEYVLNVGITPFIQIEFDSGSNLFVSAYDTSYNPLAFATNWLGDPGLSGNAFGTDPQFFQVVVPTSHDLIVVINNTAAANVGVGDPFHLIVEGFIDTDFTDAPEATAVPEPFSLALCGSGLAAMALRKRKRA